MKRSRITWLTLLVLAGVAAWYAYREYSRTLKDIATVDPDYKLAAVALINEYERSDSAAAAQYNGKVIEVTGLVKKTDKDDSGFYTIVLGDTASLSSVRCSMDSSHNGDAAGLATATMVTVRGACTGFNKDEMGLGSDVILNRCAIIRKAD